MARGTLPSAAVGALIAGFACGCSSPASSEPEAVPGGGGTAGNPGVTAGAGGANGAVAGAAGAAGSNLAGSAGTSPATAGAAGSAGSAGQACAPAPLAATNSAKLRTVAYLPTWRGALSTWATTLDFSKLTHVNIAFADVAAGGELSLEDANLCEFVNAAHASGVAVCVAVGGATTIDDPGVFGTLLQPGSRAVFIQKISAFLDAQNLDCFDVDLEGQGVTSDYTGFIAELSAELAPKNKKLSAAIARWFDKSELTAALGYFDYVNIMAYDLCKFWESTPCAHASLEGATTELDHWITSRGLAQSKAVLGVPFYGYRWQGGTGEAMTYAQIVGSYGDAAQEDWITSGNATIVHNSLGTIEDKAVLARQNGGIMIWEVGQDLSGQGSLLDAIDGAVE